MSDTDISTAKVCGKCKNEKEIAEFHRNKNRSDGRQPYCKSCCKADMAYQYSANKERRNAEARSHYQENKDEYKVRARKWEIENPERKKELAAEYRKRNSERLLAKGRTRWAKEAEKHSLRKKKYRKENPGKCNVYTRNRYARKRKAMPSWANTTAIKQIYIDCATVTELTGIKHHVDHYYPLKSDIVCGLHNEFNLRIIPATENQSKGNSIPEQE